MRPLPYSFSNGAVVLGHYKAAQRSGSIVATIGQFGHLGSIRWAPATNPNNAKFVLTRLRAGITIDGAITVATEFALRAIIVRGFTTDFTTASTAISMAGDSGKMDKSMGSSLLGATGPRIATTTVMSGQTLTADNAPFGMATYSGLVPVTATGTAVLIPVGTGMPMQTLYDWSELGGHPPTLQMNEGIVVQPAIAGPASGTFGLYLEWSWAEVIKPFGV